MRFAKNRKFSVTGFALTGRYLVLISVAAYFTFLYLSLSLIIIKTSLLLTKILQTIITKDFPNIVVA